MLLKLLKIDSIIYFIILFGLFLLPFSCKTLPKTQRAIGYTNCDSLQFFLYAHWKVAKPATFLSGTTYVADSLFINSFQSSSGKRWFDDCIYYSDRATIMKYFGESSSGHFEYAIVGKYTKILFFTFGSNGYVNNYGFAMKI